MGRQRKKAKSKNKKKQTSEKPRNQGFTQSSPVWNSRVSSYIADHEYQSQSNYIRYYESTWRVQKEQSKAKETQNHRKGSRKCQYFEERSDTSESQDSYEDYSEEPQDEYLGSSDYSSSEKNTSSDDNQEQEQEQEQDEGDSQSDYENRSFEFDNQDAIILSRQSRSGEPLLTVDQCKFKMRRHLQKLNTNYKYCFDYEEVQKPIERQDYGKKMTRAIYLVFECEDCDHRWTSIAGTFQITFKYQRRDQYLSYHIQIFNQQCIHCNDMIVPFIYQSQMEAMNIFFSVILIHIMNDVPPPERPKKYYIRDNHWHKSQLCEACQLGRCTTQRQDRKQ